MHAPCPHSGQALFHIQTRWRQQRLAQGAVAKGRIRLPAQARQFNNLAHQRIAIGMHPIRGQPQEHVALDHARRQGGAALHRAHGKAREIKISLGIHARHFSGFTANQRAARAHTALGDAFDDPGSRFCFQLAGGKIV